jgi:hypothetical protein
MHLIHIYWLAVQVPSRLLYMVLSCLGMYSTVFMPYARICGAFSLPFACYSCGHLLMLYWQIRFLLSSHFWNLKNQWRYYILCLWYELNCCLKVLASGFLHSSPVYPGGFLLSFSGFVTCSSYNCSPKVVQETHWLFIINYNGSVSNLSAFFFYRKYLFIVNFVPVEPTNSHLLLLGTAGMADMILVNSKFTASTFANTFKRLHARGIRPAVLYPAVNVDQFDEPHSYK